MKIRFVCPSFLMCAALSGCAGFVVRTLTVQPGSPIVATRPTLSYNLKRSRYDVKVELKIARATTWRKNLADEWVPDRANAKYRLVAEPNAVVVTHTFESDPNLQLAIHLDAMESAATTTKKLEVKYDASTNSLESINANFEDATLKVVENVVSIASDVVKFSAGVALTAAGKTTTPTTKIEEEILEKPVIVFDRSIILRGITPTEAGFTSVIADAKALDEHVKRAQLQVLELHRTLNGALVEQVKEKLLAAEKDETKRETIKDSKTTENLVALGASPSNFYSDDVLKVAIADVPQQIEAVINPELPDDAKAVTDLTNRVTLTAKAIGDTVVTPKGAKSSEEIPGIFFRRPGRALVTVQATLRSDPASMATFISQRMDLAEAGTVEFARVDARLFTNRTIGLKFAANGMLVEYALTSAGGAEALSKAVADGVNNGLSTAQAVEKQRKDDAESAKKESEDAASKAKKAAEDAETKAKQEVQAAANLATRIRVKEGQIFDKNQTIATNERTLTLKKAALTKAQQELKDAEDGLKAATKPNADATAEVKAAHAAKEKALADAKTAVATAEDQELTATQQVAKSKYELEVLEKELEVVKAGLNVSSGG